MFARTGRLACAALVFALLALLGAAPSAAEVPRFAAIAGHELGERISQHHEMERYLEVLAESSPRVRLIRQGESWEGRSLVAAIVTSEANHARLDEIRARAQKLGDPRKTSSEEVERWIDRQPVVLWLGGSIHGNELSGSEAMLKLLERLTLGADEEIARILNQAVVIIDPMLNPDGRDAFAQRNHQTLSRLPNADRSDWNNSYGFWDALRYRTGHYYFDTNRDWFAHTQRETRGRVATMAEWRPQIVVDAHEMGVDSEFYFDPAAPPYPPYFPDYALRGFERFGRAYAQAFDEAGFEYMTGERFNFFYPGYTTSYGSYQGAVGMLFEQGSTRGLAMEREDGSVRRLSDAMEQQFTAAWTAVKTAVEDRETLLRAYFEAHQEAIADGSKDGAARRYLIARDGDPGLLRELVELLGRNGIEVRELADEARLEGVVDRAGRDVGRRTFPAGTLVVEAAQPRNRLVRTLLEPHIRLDEEFLAGARQRLERGENPRFYDITAWSLPLLFDAQGFSTTDGAKLETRPVEEPAKSPPGRAGYAYLLDGRNAASMAALHELKRRGHRAAVLLKPSRLAGLEVAGGTVVVRVGQNDDTVHDAVREVAQRYGVRVDAVDTGLAERGWPSLGSGDAVAVRKAPKIGILAEGPVHGYSFGWAWYVLDRQYEIPTSVLRAGRFGAVDLGSFDVLVIPEVPGAAALAGLLGEAGRDRLEAWIRDGGTLVTLGGATELAREHLELVALRSWYDEQGEDEQPRRVAVPGAFLAGEMDAESWLVSGLRDGLPADLQGELPLLTISSRIYLEPEGPQTPRRAVAVRYAAGEGLRLSGHLWQENEERLPGAVFLYEERVGAGRVIAFAEDPNFRAYWRGVDRLLLNAVVLGPSAP